MNEKERLKELRNYQKATTEPSKRLNELTEIAAALCDAPMSLVTFLDDKHQWIRACKGFGKEKMDRKDSFCQYALSSPNEVLVVEDPVIDPRFKNNVLVKGEEKVRFYAGAPLISKNGHILGTLCVLGRESRKVSGEKRNALRLLAKMAMDYLETRRIMIEQHDYVELSHECLKKITDLVPGTHYQFEVDSEGKMNFDLFSQGILEAHPQLTVELLQENPETLFDYIHYEDRDRVKNSLNEAIANSTKWSEEYRLMLDETTMLWFKANAIPLKRDDGSIKWYGTVQDMTVNKLYEKSMSGFLFDISHVLRRPIATMLGLTSVIEEEELDEEKLKEYARRIKEVSKELDVYTRRLSKQYSEKELAANKVALMNQRA